MRFSLGTNGLDSTTTKPFQNSERLLSPLAPPSRYYPPTESFHMEMALTRERKWWCACTRVSSEWFFPFVWSLGAPGEPCLLHSGEQTQQLKGRARQGWSWGAGSSLHHTLPLFPVPFLSAPESWGAGVPQGYSGLASGKVGLAAATAASNSEVRFLPRLAVLVLLISALCQSSCQMKEPMWFDGPRKDSGAETQPWPCYLVPCLRYFQLPKQAIATLTCFPRVWQKKKERITDNFINILPVALQAGMGFLANRALGKAEESFAWGTVPQTENFWTRTVSSCCILATSQPQSRKIIALKIFTSFPHGQSSSISLNWNKSNVSGRREAFPSLSSLFRKRQVSGFLLATDFYFLVDHLTQSLGITLEQS